METLLGLSEIYCCPLTRVSRECGLGHLFAVCSIIFSLVPSLGRSPSLPQDGGPVLLSHSCHHGLFAFQEPDYGALYEGRHPGFYVEANPMPTFKVCSHCLV